MLTRQLPQDGREGARAQALITLGAPARCVRE
jgi:hypothetical protein